MRVVDMSASNAWAAVCCDFRPHPRRPCEHESAKAELKLLVPEDAREAFGHGVRAKRYKSGAISFDVIANGGEHASLQ